MKKTTILAAALSLWAGINPVSAYEDVGPVWSKDGKFIYFYSYRTGAAQVYRMKPDGSEQTPITDAMFHNWWNTPYSEDQLIIVSDKAEEERFTGANLFLYSLSNDSYKQLTFAPSGQWTVSPNLSSDGNWLVYLTKLEGFQSRQTALMALNMKDASTARLLPERSNIQVFALSPDGKTVLFGSRDKGNPVIISADLATGEETVILRQAEKDAGGFYDISFSTDGKKVAYSYTPSDFAKAEIYSMNRDGSGIKRMTHNDAADLYPRWSPDNQMLAFASLRDGDLTELYSMKADGSDQKNLTNTGQPSTE